VREYLKDNPQLAEELEEKIREACGIMTTRKESGDSA